jgi:hypothetical protein
MVLCNYLFPLSGELRIQVRQLQRADQIRLHLYFLNGQGYDPNRQNVMDLSARQHTKGMSSLVFNEPTR